jgi:hypothetical protein
MVLRVLAMRRGAGSCGGTCAREVDMLYSLSHLDKGKLAEVAGLEKKLGKELLAFSAYRADPDELNAEELRQIREEEKRLGLCLVAVKR